MMVLEPNHLAQPSSCNPGPPEGTSSLDWWDLFVNPELKVIICRSCMQGIKPQAESIVNHLEKYHRRRGKKIRGTFPTLQARLDEELKHLELAEPDLVMDQPPDRPAIPGLQVFPGHFCPIDEGMPCSRTFRKVATLYEHIKREHPGLSQKYTKLQLGQYQCDCQTIFPRPMVRYFKVRSGLLSGATGGRLDPYTVFVQGKTTGIPSLPDTPEPIRMEELPSLLRATRWDIFVGRYRNNPKDVVDLVRHPEARASEHEVGVEGALYKLQFISECWIDEVEGYYFDHGTEQQERILAGYPM